jgi:hypothetical protein
MLYNTQNNPKWGQLRLGNSSCTMAGFGCTTTAIANGVNKMPWEILETAKYTSNGSIIWESANTDVWKFNNRYRHFNRARIREVANNPDFMIILEVINRASPTSRHWVTLESLGWGLYNTIDPYNPKDKWNALKNFYNIYQVLGHAEFRK